MVKAQGDRKAALLASLDEARCYEAKCILGRGAELFVYELGTALPFEVRRVFTIHAESARRGPHSAGSTRSAMMKQR
jgi:hypothetical protein